MLERCLGSERSRKLRRAVRQSKVTILCLVLTVVVLRGTIGAGKFGTPKQDLLQIRHRFLAEPQTLVPRLTGWDQKRSEWLAQNPKSPRFISRGKKPRVLLVTGSPSKKPCRNPLGQRYLLKSLKNKIEYCRQHGLEISDRAAAMEAESLGFRAKLRILRSVLLSRPDVELVWWVESDAVFTDMAFEVPWERYTDHNIVIHGTGFDAATGSFLIRNCQWSLDAIKASMREVDGYLGKVYFEREYYLRAPVETGQVGVGPPPLVTHFAGCKLCGDFPPHRCLKDMDRAFRVGESRITHT